MIGSFLVTNLGWRWTQWVTIFFSILGIACTLKARETYHSILRRRREKQLGLPTTPRPALVDTVRLLVTITLVRPFHMLFTEPIVFFISFYVGCAFAINYSFFAAFPFVFETIYNFDIDQSGLVFLSIVVGAVVGSVIIMICDRLLYLRKVWHFHPRPVPPEYRLYPAMMGSIGLPLGLYWFAWTAKREVSWASSVVAIIPFSIGNLCVFISTTQYMVDTYKDATVASAMSANGLARYVLSGAFPLFTVQSEYTHTIYT